MLCADIIRKIEALPAAETRLMEVCGTHTMAIAKSGIKKMLPENVKLISGPGCPVCVTPPRFMDAALSLASRPDITVATYGDMVRVPGSRRGDNLARRRACGAKVLMVYSPMDAVDYAEEHPGTEVVFLGVGFETTAPGTAAAVLAARGRGIKNFSVFSMLKRVEPALRTLIEAPGFNIQGFLCPGHVAAVTGAGAFQFLPSEYGLPAAVSGFEPENILGNIYSLLLMLSEGKPALVNGYREAVTYEGNALALEMTDRVFAPEADDWRGLGHIEAGGLAVRPEYGEFDALRRFAPEFPENDGVSACRCGEVITGRLEPDGCPLFGKICLPEDPVGPCMVSSEGACAAAYKYREV